jgi:hypothetical protein
MPSTDTKPELTAKASMAQPVSQPAVYANGLILSKNIDDRKLRLKLVLWEQLDKLKLIKTVTS